MKPNANSKFYRLRADDCARRAAASLSSEHANYFRDAQHAYLALAEGEEALTVGGEGSTVSVARTTARVTDYPHPPSPSRRPTTARPHLGVTGKG